MRADSTIEKRLLIFLLQGRPFEEHPVLGVLLEAAGRVSGATVATDLRLALRSMDGVPPPARGISCGLPVPIVPPFGAEEGRQILQETAALLDRSHFGGQSGLRELRWSTAIFRVAGRAHLSDGLVELSWRLYCELGIVALAPIVAHELVHLWLHARRRPSGHTAEFEDKSCSLGLPEMRHALRIDSGGWRYRCPGCGRQSVRAARMPRARACARCCDEKAGGRFDRRFALVLLGRDEPRHRFYRFAPLRGSGRSRGSRRGTGTPRS